MLYDVAWHFEKGALILDWNKSALRAVILCQLERLREGPKGFNVAMDTHVAEDQQSWAHWGLPQRRIARNKERDTHFSLDPIGEQVDHLDVEV